MEKKTVDIIIPTYKPTERFIKLIDMLESQSYEVNHIYIVNTQEEYYNSLFYGRKLESRYDNISVKHISKMEFDHGGTRREAAARSDADIMVCMTDDALPYDNKLIEELIKPILEGKASISYARQLPNADCKYIEKYTRVYNYPSESMIKSKEDVERLGIKTIFCSNVCAAYDKKVYLEVGGFEPLTLFNEDSILAAKAITAGYKVAYVADAKVYHSHNLSNIQQLRRNFDNGVSHKEFGEIFDSVPPMGEGKKLVKSTMKYLWSNGKGYLIPSLIITSGFKYIGYKLGRNYRLLPYSLVTKITGNKEYWLKKNINNATVNIDPYSGYGMSEDERKDDYYHG